MADDLVMESTTDSPEQIAEGLGVELSEAPDADAEAPVAEAADASEGDADAAEPEPIAEEVTPVPASVSAPKTRTPRAQRKSADAAAAAARRKAEAELSVLQAERDALRRRLEELSAGRVPTPVATPAPAPVLTPLTAQDIGDDHPEIAAVLAKVTALGPKPQQHDFADYDEFETKKDEWIEQRATLRARAEAVRQDVARRESIAQAEANRAAQTTAAAFARSVEAARGRHADYDEKMEAVTKAGLSISRDIGAALMESPVGADVVYYLASHPEEVDRLNRLSPTRAVAEAGIIEARVAASLRGTESRSSNRPVARTTKAPDPQSTVLGDGPSSGARDINDPNLSLAEYNRLRDQMDRESGRRAH